MARLTRQAILDAVRQLPPIEQVALAQEILEGAQRALRFAPPPSPPLAAPATRSAGLLHNVKRNLLNPFSKRRKR